MAQKIFGLTSLGWKLAIRIIRMIIFSCITNELSRSCSDSYVHARLQLNESVVHVSINLSYLMAIKRNKTKE